MNQNSSRTTISLIILLIVIIAGVALYTFSPKTRSPEVNNISPEATSTLPSGYVGEVKNYYIALEDNGKSGKAIGCGDSVVPVTVSITPTQAPLKAALENLFANKTRSYGESGLMNALSQSNLSVDSAVVENGVAKVKLSGSVSLGGVCDDPRFVAQIKETVMQFPTVTSSIISINGKSLESYPSEK